jgi:hypothetical protein
VHVTRVDDPSRGDVPPWHRRAVPVVAVVAALVGLSCLVPSVREQVALSASRRPQEYAALSFTPTAKGLLAPCAATRTGAEVRFTLDSHFQRPRRLAFEVRVGPARRTGSVTLRPGRSTEVVRRLPRVPGGHDVRVVVPALAEAVSAHCGGAS